MWDRILKESSGPAGEHVAPAVIVARMLVRGARPEQVADAAAQCGLLEVEQLARRVTPGCVQTIELARAHERAGQGGVDRIRGMFDRLARVSPESAVAAYSLGDSSLFREATTEVVELIERWCSPGPSTRMLDLGCGIGRLSHAFAGRVDSVVGIDVSRAMLREARHRARGLVRPRFLMSSGTDLRAFGAGRFSLVVACDTFPYLVDSGLHRRMMQEISRVLMPAGDLVMLHFSYRGDMQADRSELEAIAGSHDMTVLRSGERPFRHWDAPAWHLKKRS